MPRLGSRALGPQNRFDYGVKLLDQAAIALEVSFLKLLGREIEAMNTKVEAFEEVSVVTSDVNSCDSPKGHDREHA